MGLDRVGKQELFATKHLPGAHDKEPNTEDKGLGIRGSYPHELLYLVFRGREQSNTGIKIQNNIINIIIILLIL